MEVNTRMLVSAALGAVSAAVAFHFLPCLYPSQGKKAQKLLAAALCPRAYVLAVRFKLRPGSLEAFKAKWAVLALNCRSGNEPNCLSYELCLGKEDSLDVLIHERYRSYEDLTLVHQMQPAYKEFGKWLNELSGDDVFKDGSKSIVRKKRKPWEKKGCRPRSNLTPTPLSNPHPFSFID
jgi:quinol monooxygenase YgiN